MNSQTSGCRSLPVLVAAALLVAACGGGGRWRNVAGSESAARIGSDPAA